MWHTFGSSGEPDDEMWRRTSPPDNEIPIAVPLDVVLARTDEAAIALLGLQVHTTGLSFDLAVRVRSSGRGGRELTELLFEHRRAEGGMLLGLQFADGRRATNIGGSGPVGGVVLHGGGGGGGDRSVDQSWWLSPLPPDGPLVLVVACAALGIEETRTEIDGSAIQRAATDVVVLWPWTPPEPPEPPYPPPDVPPGSWFAGA